MPKREYIWNGQTWVECPKPAISYADMLKAEDELRKRREQLAEDAAHPGNYR